MALSSALGKDKLAISVALKLASLLFKRLIFIEPDMGITSAAQKRAEAGHACAYTMPG